MTQLGKPLAFYLRYMAEMNRLHDDPEYGGEKPDLTGLDDAENVLQMARTVGAAAFEQAADYLELCGKGIEAHFSGLGIATLASKKKRAAVARDWFWKARVLVPSVPKGWFLCGVSLTAPPEVRLSLEKDACGIVMPWLWVKGGHKGEGAVWRILRGESHSRGVEGLGGEKGLVALASIPIKAQPPESFDVEREQLITETVKTVARIGAEQTKAIASFVAGLNEPDES
jgi:hypothetical protein